MNGIVIGVDPVMVHLGMFALRWYTVFTLIAAGTAWWLGLREARRKGLPIERIQGALVPILVGAILGARLLHVIDRPDLYLSQPAEILAIWNGGIAVWGGIIGGMLAGLLYFRRQGLDLRVVLDAAAPAMILGQGLGRLACIPNGDAYGAPTNLPWAFIYTNPAAMIPRELLGVPLQPYPLYELAFDLALFGLLWAARTRRPFIARPGLLFASYLGAYSVGRFLLTYTRVEKVWFLGLQEAQVFSIVGLMGTAVVLLFIARSPRGSSPWRASRG
ncbi:MAG TPA: prolipoprotein diacylglyceryl transferase [Candidatus Saccharimonadales bacterium]|nr:prolipoprotein diacylglyceryl transferase [Candidatus Saccharimonadales bacterium]